MLSTHIRNNYSIGCQCCQEGTWLCIFLTYLCNANCYFYISPFKHKDKIISAFGTTPKIILDNIKNVQINGISFSGGECFLVFDRLIEWLSFFKKHLPKDYFWVYTNRLAVDTKKLLQLTDAGLDEIRFNIAATNYNSQFIIGLVTKATQILENVAVEIPSIPSDYEKLLQVLPILDSISVKYLNLHEYILMPTDPHSIQPNTSTFITYDKTNSKNILRL